MERLLEFGLANAMAVAVLAPLAWVLARFWKRPAWSHAIWLIVLLKLVTPPLLRAPIVPAVEAAEPRDFAPVEVAPSVLPEMTEPVAAMPVAVLPAPIIAAEPVSVPDAPRWVLPDWPAMLALVWAGGSVAWILLATWRVFRFSRVVRRADAAPEEITVWVERLAEQIGLKRVPVVLMVRSRVSPMVWTLGGRARLIVPEALWNRLDDDQRAAMLVHELAHLKRGDPWVRLLEIVATGLYWWHPALWLSRRELHRAEEACCDLWVVWALPKSRKRYASALVEAVDYLSESRPNTLPMGASGMGQVEDLSRRIGMIMRSDAPKGLSRAGMLAVVGLGLVLLPWRATRAQQEPAKPEESKPVDEVVKSFIKRFSGDPAEIKSLGDVVVHQDENAKIPDPEDAEAAIVEAFRMNPEVVKLLDRIESLEERLRTAKMLVRNEDADPAIKRLRDMIAEKKAEYETLWKKSYPDLKARFTASATMMKTHRANLAHALKLLEQSDDEKAYENAKRVLDSTTLKANIERVEGILTQINDESKSAFVTPENVKLLQSELDRAKERLAWSQQMQAKGFLETAVVNADKERLGRIKAQLEEKLKTSPAGSRLLLQLELEKAQDRLKWAEQMHEKKYLSSTELSDAKADVQRARIHLEDERKAREEASQRAMYEVKLQEAQLEMRKAQLAKAEAQQKAASAEHARLMMMKEKGIVSSGEVAKSQSEVAITDAEVAAARAGVLEGEVLLNYAVKRRESLGKATELGEQLNKAQDAFRKAQSAVRENPLPPQAKEGARDTNQRIDELESKLDTILKEIEALRKERAGDSPRR